jgi:hypothetical protein
MKIEGKYQTQHGLLTISQNGEMITATYQDEGVCNGKLTGNKVVGTWKNNDGEGLFKWEFDSNGDFTGRYKNGLEDGAMRGKWNGVLNKVVVVSYEGYLKISSIMLGGYLRNIWNYEMPSADKLISDLEESDDISNSMHEYFRFIEFLYDEINTGFKSAIINDDVFINTSHGQINVTFINLDDSRDKPDWVFMEAFRCREDNIDLMPEHTFEFIIGQIQDKPSASFIYYPNPDAYENFQDPDFSIDDWGRACKIYNSILDLYKSLIYYHLKSLKLVDANKLNELKDHFCLFELMEE